MPSILPRIADIAIVLAALVCGAATSSTPAERDAELARFRAIGGN